MDLKSMLNDSAAHRAPPRISTASHTPHGSYDGRTDHTPSSDVTSARSLTYGPPQTSGDVRAQGGSGAGGYFGMQSPNPPHSASGSTPSVGPPSAYAQSPGNYPTVYTPRDSHPSANLAPHNNTAFVSPSPSAHPLTPGSAHHGYPPPNPYPQSNPNTPYQHFQSPPPPQPNGLPPSHPRQISPSHQFQSQPATPLGPPPNYPKASPQTQRPPSGGGLQDVHLRRASQSSIGSVLSRDYNHYPAPLADPPRRDSMQAVQRPYYELREREQSLSVSPKTIPRPPPQRDHSTSSHTLSHGRPSVPPQSEPRPVVSHHNSLDRTADLSSVPQPIPTTSVSSAPNVRQPSNDYAIYSSPAQAHAERPIMNKQPLKQEDAPAQPPAQSLKRSASHLSDSSTKIPPKRPRHDVPIWARSARGSRPLRWLEGAQVKRHQKPKEVTRPTPIPQPDPMPMPRTNGNTSVSKTEDVPGKKWKWDGTISNIIPLESITKRICDWIYMEIGTAQPPQGSMFEIEAKIGSIIHQDFNKRLKDVPEFSFIDSEVLLNTQYLKTRFDSKMTIEQHRALNLYLNQNYMANYQALIEREAREEIHYIHPKENDEFFELTEEGRSSLNPEFLHWIEEHARVRGRRTEIRVRRTVDKDTGETTATIIKTRISDKEICNPGSDFDYRISISLETPWNGNKDHLRKLQDVRDRNKDRVSYRHRMFQVDLTQVSHEDSSRQEHELEVEISTEHLRRELDKLQAGGRDSQYEPMIQDLLNNVRLLCKQGSLTRRH